MSSKTLLRFLLCFEEEILCLGYNKVKTSKKNKFKETKARPFSYFLRIYRPTWYIVYTPLAVCVPILYNVFVYRLNTMS